MPIHDWSRGSEGMFHWFHQQWVGAICNWLNAGQLPQGLYAIGELYVEGSFPDDFVEATFPTEPNARFRWDAETEDTSPEKISWRFAKLKAT